MSSSFALMVNFIKVSIKVIFLFCYESENILHGKSTNVYDTTVM